jgi:chromosome segregation ATPase
LILNEVLRKTTARHSQERESIASALYDLRRQTELLREEYEALENELRRLKDSDALVMQNSILMKELNQARYDREQTHLINETLARLHIRENLRAREANQEAAYLKEMLTATHKEVRRIAQPLEEELDASRKKIQTLQVEFDKSAQEANRAREQLLKLSEIQTERNFLRERLQSAQEEIALLQKQPPLEVEKIDPQLQEKLKFAEEKMVHLSQIEHLYLQLKKQFEEKNQVLHKARSDLFKVETEFERLKIEKASLELNPIPKEVTFELEYLSKEVQALEDENRELQDLISVLSASTSDAVKQKKK